MHTALDGLPQLCVSFCSSNKCPRVGACMMFMRGSSYTDVKLLPLALPAIPTLILGCRGICDNMAHEFMF